VLHPAHAFREVRRVLRTAAPFVVSFSNRCFPTKAVAVWLGTTDVQHVALVRTYFEATGGWTDIRAEDRSPGGGDPLYAVWARAARLPAPRLRQAVPRRPPREPLPGHAVDGRLHCARGARDRRDGLADRRLRARPALRLAVGGEPGGRARGWAACGGGLGAGGERGLARPQPRDAARARARRRRVRT